MPEWGGSVDWNIIPYTKKGCWFNSIQDTYLGFGFSPKLGQVWRQLINVSFLLSIHLPPISLPLSLKSVLTKHILRWEMQRKKSKVTLCYLMLFFKGLFYSHLRERGRDRKRETSMWERNTDWLPPAQAPTRDWAYNLGTCPDREPNWWPLVMRQRSNLLNHISQGKKKKKKRQKI